MPNRILKESICTSDSIEQLSWFEEVLFYRLIVNCDDFGRFDGRTAVIKSRCFGLKDNLTLKSVDNAIDKLARVGLITLYESDGKPFLFLPTWNEHQSIRAKRSRYPEPENICKQMHADACKCSRNPIQSESNPNPNPNPNPNTPAGGAADFERFWEAYPRHVGKSKAEIAFRKVDVPIEVLLDAIAKQKRSAQWVKDKGQFIPHPTTWLNRRGWEDELAPDTSIPKGASGTLGQAEMEAIASMMGGQINGK